LGRFLSHFVFALTKYPYGIDPLGFSLDRQNKSGDEILLPTPRSSRASAILCRPEKIDDPARKWLRLVLRPGEQWGKNAVQRTHNRGGKGFRLTPPPERRDPCQALLSRSAFAA